MGFEKCVPLEYHTGQFNDLKNSTWSLFLSILPLDLFISTLDVFLLNVNDMGVENMKTFFYVLLSISIISICLFLHLSISRILFNFFLILNNILLHCIWQHIHIFDQVNADCFQVLAIMNKAIINIYLYTFVYVSFSTNLNKCNCWGIR